MIKKLLSRIQNKHDTLENWNKATNFIPLKGEIIVYDDIGKIKIGDGEADQNGNISGTSVTQLKYFGPEFTYSSNDNTLIITT